MFELKFHPTVKKILKKLENLLQEKSRINTSEISRRIHPQQKISRTCSKA